MDGVLEHELNWKNEPNQIGVEPLFSSEIGCPILVIKIKKCTGVEGLRSKKWKQELIEKNPDNRDGPNKNHLATRLEQNKLSTKLRIMRGMVNFEQWVTPAACLPDRKSGLLWEGILREPGTFLFVGLF